MVAFNAVKAGDLLYSCHRTKMGNTSMSRMGSWTVKVVEVHEDHVVASWNGNPAKRFERRAVEKWRRSPAKQRSSA